MWEGKKGEKTSQKYKKMTKYLYCISGLSQTWPNLPTHDSSFFLNFLWMIVTLAANKVPKKDTAKSWKSCEHDLINMFHTISPIEAPLWTPRCKLKLNPSYNMSAYIFSLYTWELSFGQTIWDKTQVLLGISWGMHLKTLWKLGNPLRIWELIENMMGTHWEKGRKQKKIPVFTSLEKRKNWIVHECMLSLPIWLHETFISKTVHPHFLPMLTAGAKISGTYIVKSLW